MIKYPVYITHDTNNGVLYESVQGYTTAKLKNNELLVLPIKMWDFNIKKYVKVKRLIRIISISTNKKKTLYIGQIIGLKP